MEWVPGVTLHVGRRASPDMVDAEPVFRYTDGVPCKPTKPAEPYAFDPRTVSPSAPPIGMRQPIHYVKATACGTAKRGHALTSKWDEVDCRECLKRKPK
jgi:hypothetical protein